MGHNSWLCESHFECVSTSCISDYLRLVCADGKCNFLEVRTIIGRLLSFARMVSVKIFGFYPILVVRSIWDAAAFPYESSVRVRQEIEVRGRVVLHQSRTYMSLFMSVCS